VSHLASKPFADNPFALSRDRACRGPVSKGWRRSAQVALTHCPQAFDKLSPNGFT